MSNNILTHITLTNRIIHPNLMSLRRSNEPDILLDEYVTMVNIAASLKLKEESVSSPCYLLLNCKYFYTLPVFYFIFGYNFYFQFLYGRQKQLIQRGMCTNQWVFGYYYCIRCCPSLFLCHNHMIASMREIAIGL